MIQGVHAMFYSNQADQVFGLVTTFSMPGQVEVLLYQPHYKKDPKFAHD